jgi:TRAP-type C4-dicarboxylate transport system substrate-binding protein
VPDIPTAFSTGRVEAMITSPSTGANSKAWDFLTHYHDTQAWLPKNMVIVNKSAFDALNDAEKTAVLEAAATAETRGWEASKVETKSKTESSCRKRHHRCPAEQRADCRSCRNR